MRTCTFCGETKEAEEFGFRSKASRRRHRRCKRCVAQYGRWHYTRNRHMYIARSVANNRARRRELKGNVWHFLADHPCIDCGESDPVLLEFDHVNPETKRAEIYTLVQRAYCWATILDEITQCEVRCANCHRRRTAVQFNWPKAAQSIIAKSAPRIRNQTRNLLRPILRPSRVWRHHRVDDVDDVENDKRLCGWCGEAKVPEQFHFRDKAKGRRHSVCAECFTAYRREHYQLNRRAYIKRNQLILYARGREWAMRLVVYLREHACVDCGEADPIVLDFDHVDRGNKRQVVSWLARSGYPWTTVMAEISKCQVRCANCHRRRTAQQFDWPKLAFSLARQLSKLESGPGEIRTPDFSHAKRALSH